MPRRALGRAVVRVERATLGRWSQQSLYVARRNALRASTELARQRAEREAVEQFLRAREAGELPAVVSR